MSADMSAEVPARIIFIIKQADYVINDFAYYNNKFVAGWYKIYLLYNDIYHI